MKCLIAEDEATSGWVLEKMMAKHARTQIANNGAQAITVFSQAHDEGVPFDLIFMDIMMPEVDGLSAVQNIRNYEISKNIPEKGRVKIIMTTALADPRTVMKALYEAGANSYLVKPVQMDKLLAGLQKLNLIS